MLHCILSDLKTSKTTQPFINSPAMARRLSTPLVMLAAGLSLTAMQEGSLAVRNSRLQWQIPNECVGNIAYQI
jgi:hypothetical protein